MIITKHYLNNYSINNTLYESTDKFIERKNRRVYEANARIYDIFLSHSYLDKSLVFKLVDIFNNCGHSVYVDWMQDSQLDRSTVDEKTARLLKRRMNSSKGLAYLTTDNSTTSKWCPWELGYFDGIKNNRCCILPVLNIGGYTFTGQEYLGMYPYLDYTKNNDTEEFEFWVNTPDSSLYVSLTKWLNGAEPSISNGRNN